ncbi:hypothetical protein A167_03622 [Alcanivorax sp. S71-1-4]|uniref:DUF3592 domain-containing protein n=1 Tax=Alcanivorax sp. S71-1-4 TaxID=1177159 RepID=UPI0013568703|nr:DUF3592 domain-containing protein [Alcanivorax sp. S71-1-4]KAF0804876.1 hypothetical protein A167_03622 [Alcanivorax sp. S71-1-4]
MIWPSTPGGWWLLLTVSPLLLGIVLMLVPVSRRESALQTRINLSMGLMAIGLIALGLSLAVMEAISLARGQHSLGWQPVAATVESSRVVLVDSSRGTQRRWRLEVSYQYVHHGLAYQGSRLAFRRSRLGDRAWLRQLQRDVFFPGARVTAWIDPDMPQQAVLERGASQWLSALIACGALLVCAGLHLMRLAGWWPGVSVMEAWRRLCLRAALSAAGLVLFALALSAAA